MEAGSPTPHFYCSPTTRTAGLTCYKLSINYDLNLDFQIILLKAPSNQTCKELLVFKGTYYNFFISSCAVTAADVHAMQEQKPQA